MARPEDGDRSLTLASIDAALATDSLKLVSIDGASANEVSATGGYLQKKAGGKRDKSTFRLKQSWSKRYFFLEPRSSVLKYYKDADASKQGSPLGSLDVSGCTLFLKKMSHGVHRFTIASDARELKLRAYGEEDYVKWVNVLRPHVSTFRELADEDSRPWDDAQDEEVDDDDEEEDFRHARERAASSARARGASSARARGTTFIVPEGRPGDVEGYLEKKQGGKEGKSSTIFGLDKQLGKWERRYFVLLADSSELRYYNSPAEYLAHRPPLGSLVLGDGAVFRKSDPRDISKGKHRFTVKEATRELKLRADSKEECSAWLDALSRPGRATLLGGQRASVDDGVAEASEEEDDDEQPCTPPARPPALREPAGLPPAPPPVPKGSADSESPFAGEDDEGEVAKPQAAPPRKPALDRQPSSNTKRSAMAILSAASER